MDNKIKYLIFIFFSYFLLISFSHTFKPYSFSISLPRQISTKINEEIHVYLIIKNIGMIGDFYNVSIIPKTLDTFVSYNYTEIMLNPGDLKEIPITVIVYSSLGNKIINVSVCSLGLLNQGLNNLMWCSSESCELEEGFACISSDISFSKIASINLGNFLKEFILFPLFLLIFVILLNFAECRHQKPYNDHHH